jgi:protein-S-isoprenylcysteine O-methyltransferase Ste14
VARLAIVETKTFFRILVPALIVLFVMHRGYYVTKHSKPKGDTLKERENGLASNLAGLLSLVGFVAIIAQTAQPGWIAWADLPLPNWVRWMGIAIALFGFGLLQWAQNTLGKNWSDTPRMLKEQYLVMNGPYRFIRHPIYTAFFLILGSTLFISANWLVGLAWIGMTVLEIASRIGFEENLMIEYFGDEYRDYMKKTGRLLPKIIR